MLRLLLVFLFFTLTLFAYIDSDMDGVADIDDHCPNTPMTDLVELSGCSKKSLLSPHHFALIAGEGYAKINDVSSTFSSLELDYFYKKFSLQLVIGYYNLKSNDLNNSGLNDSYLNFSYTLSPMENFKLSLSGGIAFPTYQNADNKIDYSASLYGRYYLNTWSFSMGIGYRLMGDTNTRNTLYYSLGTAYRWNNKLYSSLSYSVSQNIYEGNADLKSLSLYNYYKINNNWFTTLNYSYGLNIASLDHSIGVKIGYYW